MEIKLTDIKNVLILGSGTLGLRIGLQSGISGFNTTIYDIGLGVLRAYREKD
jgi:3-hydroxybutyryl-CoA dehydrogenase